MSELSNNIKKLRIKYGYSQPELAKKLGISRSAISMYENGNREPNLELLEAMCDIFNVSSDYLTGISATTPVIPDIDFFLNDEERAIILAYRKTDEMTRKMVCRLLEYKNNFSEEKK